MDQQDFSYDTNELFTNPSTSAGNGQPWYSSANSTQNFQEKPGAQGAKSMEYFRENQSLPSFQSAFPKQFHKCFASASHFPFNLDSAETRAMNGATSINHFQQTQYLPSNKSALHLPLQHAQKNSPSAPSLPVSLDSARNEDISSDNQQSADGAPVTEDHDQLEFFVGMTCPFLCKTKGTMGRILKFNQRGNFRKHIRKCRKMMDYEFCLLLGCNKLFENSEREIVV